MQACAAHGGSDGCAIVRRFLVDECAQTRYEDRAGIRIRCVDFFERFKEWGGISTHWFFFWLPRSDHAYTEPGVFEPHDHLLFSDTTPCVRTRTPRADAVLVVGTRLRDSGWS